VSQHEYLCIGGAFDGKRILLKDCPPPPVHQFPILSEPPLSVVAKATEEQYPVETYQRQKLHESGRDYYVYVSTGLKDEGVIARLIGGYRAASSRK